MGRRGIDSTRYSGEPAARQHEIRCSGRAWPPTPVFLREKPDRSVHRITKSDTMEATSHAQRQDFFYPLAALSQWGSCVEESRLLGSQGPW